MQVPDLFLVVVSGGLRMWFQGVVALADTTTLDA